MKEWDYGTHRYTQYKVPADWYCPLIAGLEEKVNCARCGKEVTFGDTYTSMELFEDGEAFGYSVCEECHEKEYERAKEDSTWS